MRITQLIILALWLMACTAHAQPQKGPFDFVQYLITKKYYDEAIYELNRSTNWNNHQSDSVNFLLGDIYYAQQKLPESIRYFDQVSSFNYTLKARSVFFSSFNESYLRKLKPAEEKLLAFQTNDTLLSSLRNFELSGIALLCRNYSRFDSITRSTPSRNFILAQQVENFQFYKRKSLDIQRKSPFKAAIASALIPGAGKLYAGHKGQAIFNFIIAGLLGIQAWEGYYKDGPESARFIVYGALFTSFYVATIWGSALSVKIKRQEINQTIDEQILFDMHIPLRKAFR